jgi:stearoyl-CoA desaturase (delta-9 desaturase)
LVSYLAVGEGWHNYHHTFPWDYKAAEIGIYKHNWSAMFLDFFAYIGWAYDLKTVPENVVRDRVNRTGDGSHITYGHGKKTDSKNSEKNDAKSEKVVHVWGWGDKDMTEEHYKLAETIRPGIRAG